MGYPRFLMTAGTSCFHAIARNIHTISITFLQGKNAESGASMQPVGASSILSKQAEKRENRLVGVNYTIDISSIL